MNRTLKIRINDPVIKNEYLNKMREVKNFYNSALFLTRFKFFFKQNKRLLDFNPVKEFNLEEWITDNNVFIMRQESYGNNFGINIQNHIKTNLGAKEIQSILRVLARDWRSFFASLKSDKLKDKKKNIPQYKKSDFAMIEFNKQMISFKNFSETNEIVLTKTKGKIKLPNWLKQDQIQSARLRYKNSFVYLEVIYNKTQKKIKDNLLKRRVAAIDPGLNNIVTMTFNWMKKPIGFKGRKIKSINQWYNKETSRLKTLLSHSDVKFSKKIARITEKRNLSIQNEMNRIGNAIIKILLENRVKTLVFGHNKGQKDNINIGKHNNQNFVLIPMNYLIEQLAYKCSEVGINFVIQEESYTSKASFLSSDFIPVYSEEMSHVTFNGKRTKRGIYIDTVTNIKLNADVNGSYNIMRKFGINLSKLSQSIIAYNKKIELYSF